MTPSRYRAASYSALLERVFDPACEGMAPALADRILEMNFPGSDAAPAGARCEYHHLLQSHSRAVFISNTSRPNVTEDLDNLALACRGCNMRKSINPAGIDPHTGDVVALYPRRDLRRNAAATRYRAYSSNE